MSNGNSGYRPGHGGGGLNEWAWDRVPTGDLLRAGGNSSGVLQGGYQSSVGGATHARVDGSVSEVLQEGANRIGWRTLVTGAGS